MLRSHSGPSVSAAALAVLAFLSVDVSAQQAADTGPSQAVVPETSSTAAPTTQRVSPPSADVSGAASQPAPSVEAASPAPAPVAPPVAAPEAPASPPASAESAAPSPPPAAQVAPAPSEQGVQQPMPAAPADHQLAPSMETELAPVEEEASAVEAIINSYMPGLLPERNENLPHDLSPMGMFLAADWVVKGVMLSLAFASLVTWTVWIAKTLQLTGAKARAAKGIKAVTTARSLSAALEILGHRGGTVASMVRVAAHEVRLSDAAIDHAGGDGVKERVGSALGRIEVQAGRNMSKGTGVLATIGSTAPFVGLFGTVWGIMNSFIGISESQTTNLAVVAPGIAEALLATAIGLVAAIPAVIIYNVFARSVTAYRQSLADAAAGIERLVSRDLDFRKIPVEARANPKIKLVTE